MYLRLEKIVGLLCIVTIVAVIYIYMQMRIIDLGYKQRSRQEHIGKLREQNNHIVYTIARLKSASHLGHVMLTKDSQMQFVDCDKVFRVAVYNPSFNDSYIRRTASVRRDTSLFAKLLSLVSQTEAMAEE